MIMQNINCTCARFRDTIDSKPGFLHFVVVGREFLRKHILLADSVFEKKKSLSSKRCTLGRAVFRFRVGHAWVATDCARVHALVVVDVAVFRAHRRVEHRTQECALVKAFDSR